MDFKKLIGQNMLAIVPFLNSEKFIEMTILGVDAGGGMGRRRVLQFDTYFRSRLKNRRGFNDASSVRTLPRDSRCIREEGIYEPFGFDDINLAKTSAFPGSERITVNITPPMKNPPSGGFRVMVLRK